MNNIVFAGLGAHTQINVAAPSAGAAVSHSSTLLGRLWVTAVTFKLVTSAVVADRYCTLSFKVAGEFIAISPEYGIKQTASAIIYWIAQPNCHYWSGTGAGYAAIPLSSHLIIPGTFDLGISARNMDANDQFDEIIIWALRWLDPNV